MTTNIRRGFEIGDVVELRYPLYVDYTECIDDEDPPPKTVKFSIGIGERGVIVSDPMNFGVPKQAVRFINAPNWPNLYWKGEYEPIDFEPRSIGSGHYVECRNLSLVSAAPKFCAPDLSDFF